MIFPADLKIRQIQFLCKIRLFTTSLLTEYSKKRPNGKNDGKITALSIISCFAKFWQFYCRKLALSGYYPYIKYHYILYFNLHFLWQITSLNPLPQGNSEGKIVLIFVILPKYQIPIMSNYMDVLEIWAFWGSKFSSLPISILVFLSRYLLIDMY